MGESVGERCWKGDGKLERWEQEFGKRTVAGAVET